MLTDKESKAAGFNSMVRTVREQIGEANFEQMVLACTPETQGLIRQPPLSHRWIKDTIFNDILRVLADGSFKANPDGFYELGRAQMHRDMNTIYKFFMHLVSTQSVLRKAATIYGTYTKNGSMRATELGPREAEITIEDVEDTFDAVWEYQRGTIAGVLECAGAKGMDVRIVRGGGQTRSCVFHASWT